MRLIGIVTELQKRDPSESAGGQSGSHHRDGSIRTVCLKQESASVFLQRSGSNYLGFREPCALHCNYPSLDLSSQQVCSKEEAKAGRG